MEAGIRRVVLIDEAHWFSELLISVSGEEFIVEWDDNKFFSIDDAAVAFNEMYVPGELVVLEQQESERWTKVVD